jgi:hypothetical protein
MDECKECKHFNKCYPIPCDSDRYPGSLVNYFRAIRERDLCVYNGKDKYEPVTT